MGLNPQILAIVQLEGGRGCCGRRPPPVLTSHRTVAERRRRTAEAEERQVAGIGPLLAGMPLGRLNGGRWKPITGLLISAGVDATAPRTECKGETGSGHRACGLVRGQLCRITDNGSGSRKKSSTFRSTVFFKLDLHLVIRWCSGGTKRS
jgi:hypothetical protein